MMKSTTGFTIERARGIRQPTYKIVKLSYVAFDSITKTYSGNDGYCWRVVPEDMFFTTIQDAIEIASSLVSQGE